MTGDGGEYLRPEDLRELGDDSLPSSQFLDGMNYLRYSLEGGRSDRYLPGYGTFLMLLLHENSFCCKCVKSLCGGLSAWCAAQHLFTQCGSHHLAGGRGGHPHLLLPQAGNGWTGALSIR